MCRTCMRMGVGGCVLAWQVQAFVACTMKAPCAPAVVLECAGCVWPACCADGWAGCSFHLCYVDRGKPVSAGRS